MVEYSSNGVERESRKGGSWAESVGGGTLLEVRSEMLDVRNYLATLVQTFHFYGLTIEARGKKLRLVLTTNYIIFLRL